MASNDTRLIAALRRLMAMKPKSTPAARPPHDAHDWQSCIEAELDAINRKLARLEIFLYVVIVLVVASDVSKAADLLRAWLGIP